MEMAFVLVKAKHRNPTWQGYNCAVSKRQVQWYVDPAFHNWQFSD